MSCEADTLLSDRYTVTSLLLDSLDADVVSRCRLVALLSLLLPSRDVGDDVTASRDVGDVIGGDDVIMAAAVLYEGGDAACRRANSN